MNHNTETVAAAYRKYRSGGKVRADAGAARALARLPPRHRNQDWQSWSVSASTWTSSWSYSRLAPRRRFHPDNWTVSAAVRVAHDDGALLNIRTNSPAQAHCARQGLRHVESGPLFRSSYHAHEQAGRVSGGDFQVTGWQWGRGRFHSLIASPLEAVTNQPLSMRIESRLPIAHSRQPTPTPTAHCRCLLPYQLADISLTKL